MVDINIKTLLSNYTFDDLSDDDREAMKSDVSKLDW